MVSGHSLAMIVRHRRTVMRGGGLRGELAPKSIDQVEQLEAVTPVKRALGLRTTAQLCETVGGHPRPAKRSPVVGRLRRRMASACAAASHSAPTKRRPIESAARPVVP